MSSVLEHGIWSAPLPLFQPSPPHPFSLFPYPLLPLYSQPTLILHLYHLHHLLSLLTSPSQSLFFRPLPPLNHPSAPHHPPSVPHLTPCLPILPLPSSPSLYPYPNNYYPEDFIARNVKCFRTWGGVLPLKRYRVSRIVHIFIIS